MSKQERHDYLLYLIEHLEKSNDNTALDNFFIVAKDILKVRHALSRVLDYPISLEQYEELITYAENLLGVNRFGSSDDLHYEHLLSGRTEGATSAHGASDIVTDALVEQALNEKLNNMMAYDEEDTWKPNEETLAALQEAMNEDPKNFKTWPEVKQEFNDYYYYWTDGIDAHFFYDNEFERAWKCADEEHKFIYYWPYNNQIIVGKVNKAEWYKTKGDEKEWGPIFGPFNTPEEFNGWYEGFWKWWHRLSENDKEVYHNIPKLDNEWVLWNINYIEMFRHYKTKEYDYATIAARAQNDAYSKMSEQELDNYYKRKSYWEEAGWGMNEAFSDDWKDDVCNLVGEIKEVESRMGPDNDNNVFDSETLHYLEQKLLNLLKRTL